MKKLTSSLLLVLCMIIAPTSFAADIGATTYASSNSFDDTLSKILDGLQANGFMIKNKINHQKIAASLGHDMKRNMQVLYGKPTYEYPLLVVNPRFTLFVPLVVVVWEDKDNKIYVSYWDPEKDLSGFIKKENNKELEEHVKKTSESIRKVLKDAGVQL